MIEYNHPEILSDFREALCALCPDNGDGSNRYLRAEPANARRIFVFSMPNGLPMRSEFPITSKVFQELMKRNWTQPTYANRIFDRTRLVVSNSGSQAYRDNFHEELVIDALANLSASTGGMRVLIHLTNRTYWFVAEKPTGNLRGRTVMSRIFDSLQTRGLIEPAPALLDDKGQVITYPARFQISSHGSAYISSIRS